MEEPVSIRRPEEYPHSALTRGVVVRIIRVLGEGGFSFVYLVEDENSGVQSLSRQAMIHIAD